MKQGYSLITIILLSLVFTFISGNALKKEKRRDNKSQNILDYFELLLSRQAGPTGKVEASDVAIVESQIASLAASNYKTNNATLRWSEMGPDNVGGRTLGILADNQHENWIYAGAASGGLWLSKTGGTSWYHISNNSDYYENLCVSSITQTPDGDIYFGTGEESFGGLRGGGVWRKDKDSTDFKRINGTNPAVGGSNWNNTNFMAASSKRDRIFAGNNGGLYLSDDDGKTWKFATGTVSGNCTEVKADPDGTIIAIINKKLYVSSNDGESFFFSTTGLPSVGLIGRPTVAIASKNTNYLYVVYSKINTNDCYGAYRSLDKGLTWQLIQLGNPYFNPFFDQGWYDICSAVDPENENRLFLGGVTFWEWNGPGTNFVETGINIHADLHNITIDTRTNPYSIIIGCDGGVYRSNNKAKWFFPLLKLYTTTQFYSMAASRDDNIVGGTQDNGSLYINKLGNTIKSAYSVWGGDGFFCEQAWQNESEVKFVESQYANLRRNKANAAMQPFYDDEALKYIADANGGFSRTGNGQFSSPFTLWEHPTNDSISYFAIGVRGAIFFTKQSTNFSIVGGPKWYKLAAFSGNVTCVEFSNDGDQLYFGVGNSVYRASGINTAVFDETFSTNPSAHGISFNLLPFNSGGSSVQGITCDLKYKNRLLITTGNYGFPNHVFISRNADEVAANFKYSTIQNNLPAFPCYDAAFDYSDSSVLLVGTEYGMYASENSGVSWSEQNSGMSRVAVYQVRQYIDTRQPWTGSTYYLATFGRGMFKSTSLTTGIAKSKKLPDPHAFSIFPNPAIDFVTINGLHSGTTRIFNMQGKCVYSGKVSANESTDVSNLPNGNYIFELVENGERSATKFVKL